ncbi:hypothetical protein RND81_13G130900 [Saponaria officinalis]|uniref:Uncharacterized protein n=1 Tax=Saponaria officinalis TaxID=3572 RepID=A0AAW1GX87_SAPOF
MRFQNRKSFKDAVTKYAISQGRHLTFKISDTLVPDKDKVEEQQPKRARGRPKIYEEPVEGTTHQARYTEHHSITIEPTRTGRYGRTVRSGRDSRGGRDRGGTTHMSLVHPTSTTPTGTVMSSLNSQLN